MATICHLVCWVWSLVSEWLCWNSVIKLRDMILFIVMKDGRIWLIIIKLYKRESSPKRRFRFVKQISAKMEKLAVSFCCAYLQTRNSLKIPGNVSCRCPITKPALGLCLRTSAGRHTMPAGDFNDWHWFQQDIMSLFFLDSRRNISLTGVLKYFLYTALAQFVYNEWNEYSGKGNY